MVSQIIFILLVLSLIGSALLFAMLLTVKAELKHLQDNFQLKLLSKHVALTREIEALTRVRNKELDFTELDSIIERLRTHHNDR